MNDNEKQGSRVRKIKKRDSSLFFRNIFYFPGMAASVESISHWPRNRRRGGEGEGLVGGGRGRGWKKEGWWYLCRYANHRSQAGGRWGPTTPTIYLSIDIQSPLTDTELPSTEDTFSRHFSFQFYLNSNESGRG